MKLKRIRSKKVVSRSVAWQAGPSGKVAARVGKVNVARTASSLGTRAALGSRVSAARVSTKGLVKATTKVGKLDTGKTGWVK